MKNYYNSKHKSILFIENLLYEKRKKDILYENLLRKIILSYLEWRLACNYIYINQLDY